METVTVQLYKAKDAEEAYALRYSNQEAWLAQTGFGSEFEPVWKLEVQSDESADPRQVDWDAVLQRAIEAYRLSDPVLTKFRWPIQVA